MGGQGSFSKIHVSMAIHDASKMVRERRHVVLGRHGMRILTLLSHGEDQRKTVLLEIDTSGCPRSGPEVTNESMEKRDRIVIDKISAASETK